MLELFPGQKLAEGNLSVVTLAIRTEHDMSTWSDQVEEERERLTEHLVITAKEVCGQLKEEVSGGEIILRLHLSCYFVGRVTGLTSSTLAPARPTTPRTPPPPCSRPTTAGGSSASGSRTWAAARSSPTTGDRSVGFVED